MQFKVAQFLAVGLSVTSVNAALSAKTLADGLKDIADSITEGLDIIKDITPGNAIGVLPVGSG